MKKQLIFITMSLVLILFFACNMQMPSEIRIIKTQNLRFPISMNISERLMEELTAGFEDADAMAIHCTNPALEYMTYIFYLELYDESLSLDNLPPGSQFLPGDIGITVPERILLIESNSILTLPLSVLGEFMYGFSFSEVEAKLYFSGSKIVEKLSVEIIVDGDVQTLNNIVNINSGYNESWNDEDGYNGTALPVGGDYVFLQLEDKDIDISFRVFIKQGEILYADDFGSDSRVFVELVVWAPFVLEADDNMGSAFILPENVLFESGKDFFGRKDPYDDNTITEMIKNLTLEIVMDINPFSGAELVVDSKNISFSNSLTGNSFRFNIDEDTMNKINTPANYPFIPNFRMIFQPGAELLFPREFKAMEILFEAKIDHTFELSEGE